jgi:ubiquinone/menaquinone biosynthesis C-methylase UbiE
MMNDDYFIHEYLQRHSGKGDTVLDLGCGPGRFRKSVIGYYVGLDITTDDYQDGSRRLIDVVASARFLPFQDSVFDLIFTVASFHLFSGPVLCLKEIYRCLKSGGKFVCFDYTRKTLERFIQPYYETNISSHSIWTGRQLVSLFKVVGFGDVTWWVPDTGMSYKSKIAHLLSPIYRYFHDLREGWWVVEGEK